MRQLIVACSLSPKSLSAQLALRLSDSLKARGEEVELLDLREIELPFCDAGSCYSHPNVQRLQAAIGSASAITLATPIYNYETGGATRNLIALTGKAWTEKIVSFLCAAGGQGSYMSVMSLANSLMLDFRCLILPRFVYATGAAFEEGALTSDEVAERIDQLSESLQTTAQRLA